jgi:hypothetical protein
MTNNEEPSQSVVTSALYTLAAGAAAVAVVSAFGAAYCINECLKEKGNSNLRGIINLPNGVNRSRDFDVLYNPTTGVTSGPENPSGFRANSSRRPENSDQNYIQNPKSSYIPPSRKIPEIKRRH